MINSYKILIRKLEGKSRYWREVNSAACSYVLLLRSK